MDFHVRNAWLFAIRFDCFVFELWIDELVENGPLSWGEPKFADGIADLI